jgi:hyperosmotically inducible protein
MKPGILGQVLVAVVLAGAPAVAASSDHAKVPVNDAQLADAVRHEIVMYSRYSIWDDISFRVANGQVELMGAVNQPYKKSDIDRIVRRVPGVVGIQDDIRVLPLSNNDDRLRLQVARAIYRDPSMTRYAIQAVPPIHIIVENGHVTLEGTVATEFDKNMAGIRASGAGLSFGPVVNHLQVEQPAKRS